MSSSCGCPRTRPELSVLRRRLEDFLIAHARAGERHLRSDGGCLRGRGQRDGAPDRSGRGRSSPSRCRWTTSAVQVDRAGQRAGGGPSGSPGLPRARAGPDRGALTDLSVLRSFLRRTAQSLCAGRFSPFVSRPFSSEPRAAVLSRRFRLPARAGRWTDRRCRARGSTWAVRAAPSRAPRVAFGEADQGVDRGRIEEGHLGQVQAGRHRRRLGGRPWPRPRTSASAVDMSTSPVDPSPRPGRPSPAAR